MTDSPDIKPMKFDPSDVITFKFKNKNGGETETKMLKGTSAMNWFYAEHPLGEGRIITDVVQVEPPVIRAEIWINGDKVATGHANIDGNCNTFKKVETVAIRRALANAGYGTEQIIKRIADSIGVEAAKQMLGSGKGNGERKMGQVGHKVSDLESWALNAVYDGNEYHMKGSIQKLVSAGKLHNRMTLDEAKAVVTSRHAEEAKEQVKQEQEAQV